MKIYRYYRKAKSRHDSQSKFFTGYAFAGFEPAVYIGTINT